ncbi:hypothetical protein BAS10_13130 [Elizabethkingia meningoseptica]|uniref:hypothetical protein n=1 Tax=Elizabethkingia meningoseptica TaxID=238 RepID=UPI000998ED2D|nr:hypothetical protein [Elizabethkingia meningoseptica]OPB93740.1 hypothetical protein BAS10_13130 [Elizabethkingia meningoseptica]
MAALTRSLKLIESLNGNKFPLGTSSFATLFLSKGVPLESLSKMKEHKNIATMQIHAKIHNEKVGLKKVSLPFKKMERFFITQF